MHKNIDKNTKYDLVKCALFLEKNGTACLSLNDSKDPIKSAKEFLENNEIYTLGEPVLSDKIIYVSVDHVKTDLSSFYNWSEIIPSSQPMKEVWRQFIWNMNDPDSWGTNVYLDSVEIGPLNIGQILRGYFKTLCV